jgi:hypothetical protein
MGLSDIAYFAFCIVSKAVERPIYEQSIHCQVDKIKKSWMLGELLLLIYLYDADAISTHISALCVSLKRHYYN